MNHKSNGKSLVVLRKAITLLGQRFWVVAGVFLCLQGQRIGAVTLFEMGDNGHGQLGNNTTTPTNKPSLVLTGQITAAGAGTASAYAIQNGALYAWGYNLDGQLGIGTTNESYSPVPVSGLSNGVTAVTGGLRHCLALKDGIVYAWGYNGTGELGNGAFDYTLHATPAPVTGLTGVVAIAAGDYHSFALQNGTVYAWGWNNHGELGNGGGMQNLPGPITGLTDGVTAIAAGSYFGLAIKNGAVWGWGDNSYGQLGTGSSTPSRQDSPVLATNLTNGVTAIAAGNSHGLAVRNGVVYAWGRNYAGEVGNGGWSSIYLPTVVGGLPTNMVEVAAGYWSSFARSADGRLWAWGNGLAGQLGTGANLNYNTAQEVTAPTGYVFKSITIDASGYFAVAISAAPSEPTAVLSLSWSNNPSLAISGFAGDRYALEYISTWPPNDSWQRLATNTFTSIPWTFTDTNAAGNGTRFYRAALLP